MPASAARRLEWAPRALQAYIDSLAHIADEEGRTPDEHDAYAVARWLAESAARGSLERYFNPPLTTEERRVAGREGWILGVG